MSRNLSASVDLASRYSVGEIEDFIGVPNYYDAGTSQWMKTGAWVDASSISSGVKTSIKAAGSDLVAIATNSLIDETYPGIAGVLPPAVVGSARVFGYSSNVRSHSALSCLTVNANGLSLNAIGQTAGYTSHGTNGGGNAITSDGTKFWSWTAASTSAFGAYSSTDGVTWTSASLTGQATFAVATTHMINGGGSIGSSTGAGETFVATTSYVQIAAYCGARHLLIGLNGSNQWLAQRSSNGLAWGGDETTTILGSATLAASPYAWFYNNGNTFYVSLGVASGQRKTTDGGATWAAATNALVASATVLHRINSSDATRLAALTLSGTAMAFSADSGATWTSRTAPFTLASGAANTSFWGRGSSWVICDCASGLTYKTTDDGANWTQVTAPVGFTGAIQSVCADANRWYLCSAAGNQVATSTDLTTWTVRNIGSTTPGVTQAYAPYSLVATDSNTIIGMGGNGYTLSSSDGGVTWRWWKPSSGTTATASGATYLVANTTGTSCFVSGTCSSSASTVALVVTAADVAAGGASYRASTSVVSPVRTNALAYARVG